MTKSELIELVIKSIPYPDQIKDIDITTSEYAIRFNWRGITFRISERGGVEEVEKGLLCGSNIAIIFEHLIKKTILLRDLGDLRH